MILSSVVVHQIDKNEDKTGEDNVHLILSDKVLDNRNSQIVNIIERLNQSFIDKSIRRAILSDSETGFKANIEDFSKISLLDISQKLTKNLYQQIFNITKAKGGYLVFSLYEFRNHNYLGAFFVRKTEGSNIEFQDKEKIWEIELVKYLDVNHFAMGVRINLSKLEEQPNSRYLQLVKGSTDISKYFENWIGITDTLSEDIDGKNFYDVINMIPLSSESERDELKRKIYIYAKEQTEKIINIRHLSDYLFSDETYLVDYCENNDVEISHEFRLKGKNLSKFYKVSATSNGITLQAPYDKFNGNDIDIIDDSTIIIHSESLVELIKQQKGELGNEES